MNKKNINILLISLYNDEAYGLRLLHSILYKEGYNVKLLFLKINEKTMNVGINRVTEKELDLLCKVINIFNPRIVGFSLVSSNFNLYKRIYNKIRPLGRFTIIVGGWQASLNPEETIKYCDILYRGEGLSGISKLMEAICKYYSLMFVKNIWFNTDVGIFRNDLNPLIDNLDSIPIPVLNDNTSAYIENDKIIFEEPYLNNSRYGTVIGLGCCYICSYCSNSYMKKLYPYNWSRIRHRSISYVIEELKLIKKQMKHLRKINFYDEVFKLPNNLHSEFCKEYKKHIKLPFYCMFYPGILEEKEINDLKNAGLKGIWLGIQSGSERVRREIFKRYYSNEQIKRDSEILHKYKINTRYDIILDNPFETSEETMETFKLLKELPKPFSVNFFSLKFFPNTEITQMALKRGLITEENLNDQLKEDHQIYLINKQKKEEIIRYFNDNEITVL